MACSYLGGVAPIAGDTTAVFVGGGGTLPGDGAETRFVSMLSFLRSAANRPRMLDTTIDNVSKKKKKKKTIPKRRPYW